MVSPSFLKLFINMIYDINKTRKYDYNRSSTDVKSDKFVSTIDVDVEWDTKV